MALLHITKENFQSEVMSSDKPVLIDFFADWCGPCKMIAPIMEELGVELKDSIKVAKLNVDTEPELAGAFGVMSIPTIIVMKDGKIVNKAVGFQNKSALKRLAGV